MSSQTPVSGWDVVDGQRLHKKFRFPDFAQALAFVNRIGAEAEAQNHHPELLLGWGKVEVSTWTHTANGITDKDHRLAAAIDRISSEPRQ
jgi:4a-hydroxytetrahydrobiopterin dehydratase